MEAYMHGRCVPWQIGTGNRRQICDFEVQPSPHDQMPRWVQEKPPMFQSSCPNQEDRNPLHFQPHPSMQHQQQLRQQRFFGDEMLMTDFHHMDAIEKRFYVPPEFREQRQRQVKGFVGGGGGGFAGAARSDKRECRSMCMPEGMGAIDPNCQGEDYRVNSGYQPSRPGDAVDRRFNPCSKWRPFRDGTSEGHKAAHWQFGKDGAKESSDKECETNACPENVLSVGHRSVYPKFGGMVPGYGGHVPGFERCKFGKTFGRETAASLKKVKSTGEIPRSYAMAEWRTKCYNKEINC